MSDTPQLVNWAGMLTDAGIALAAWLNVTEQPIPDVPAKPRDSTPLVARYFDACPEEAAALWRAYAGGQEEVLLHE